MGWLGLKKRPGHDKDEGDQLGQEPQPLQPLTPVLNLLVPDIAGVTSFHLRQFFDAGAAQEFIQTLPSISGLHAFWGLNEPPPGHQDGEGTGEAMVLIRSVPDSDTVYVVSFVDLDSALSFARFEVKRGMSLSLLLIYWAEIVEVDADEYGVRLYPDVPPLPGYESHRSWDQIDNEPPAETAPVAEVAPPNLIPVPQVTAIAEEPEPTVIEETEDEQPQAPEPELSWEAETTEDFERETEEEFEQFVAEQVEQRAAEQAAPDAQAEAPPEIEEEAPEPEPVSFYEPEPVSAEPVAVEPEAVSVEEPEPVAAEPDAEERTQEEIDIEREAIAFLKASANGKNAVLEPDTAPESVVEVAAAPEPEPVETTHAITEPEPVEEAAATPQQEEVPQPPVPVTAHAGAAAPHEPESEEELGEDLVEEVEKILKVKRWDKRESPFRGFDSPPGRF